MFASTAGTPIIDTNALAANGVSLASATSRHSPRRLVEMAEADPKFQEIKARFASAGIRTWLTETEKALHFGVGAFAEGLGVTVELGTFEGGAAMFLAAGTALRGTGRLVCVDPHFGGPPWLGMGPVQRTLEQFARNSQYCNVSEWIETRVGDSAAVAAVWPGEQIDTVFIDGDHSYIGALKDFECWAPKVRAGGWVMVDDADDQSLPELLKLVDEIKSFQGVTFCELIDGIAMFRRNATSANDLLSEISALTQSQALHRPWDLRSLHQLDLPGSFMKSFDSQGATGADVAYQLSFLAKCGQGPYGYTPAAGKEGAQLLRAVSRDRGDGPAFELGETEKIPCRTIFCAVEEQAKYASHLMPGGLLLTYNRGELTQKSALQVRTTMLDAGLEGCGWSGAYHWGVWKPFALSAEAVVGYTMQAYGVA